MRCLVWLMPAEVNSLLNVEATAPAGVNRSVSFGPLPARMGMPDTVPKGTVTP